MSQRTMSINQALANLKTLRARLDSLRMRLNVAKVVRPSDDRIGTQTRDEFVANQTRTIQEHIDTLAEYRKIKSAITKSNAETVITVAGVTDTVAGFIERKRSLELEVTFLRTLQTQYMSASNELKLANDQCPAKIEQFLAVSLGPEKTRKIEDIKAQTELWESRNKPEILAPAGLSDQIDRMRQELEDFTTEVNWALTDANAKATITV